jgi:hypothetical protein
MVSQELARVREPGRFVPHAAQPAAAARFAESAGLELNFSRP